MTDPSGLARMDLGRALDHYRQAALILHTLDDRPVTVPNWRRRLATFRAEMAGVCTGLDHLIDELKE